MLNGRSRAKFQTVRMTAAVLAGLAVLIAGSAGPAASGTGTLSVAITPGHPIAVAIVPPPPGTVSDGRTPACVAVVVRTTLAGWSLSASYATTSTASLDVVPARRAAGESCTVQATTAGEATRLSAGDAVTLLSNQSGSQTLAYALVVRPSGKLSAPTTLDLAFTATAPGASPAQALLTLGVDRSGRVSQIGEALVAPVR